MSVTRREAAMVMIAINAIFPKRFPLPEDPDEKKLIVDVWYTLLQDLPAGAALAACNVALRSAQHPPTAAEIRRSALATGLESLSGAEAWDLVCKSISLDGMNRPDRASQRWNNPAIDASVAAVGGWRAICLSDNTVADRSQFIRYHDSQVERARASVLAGESPSVRHAIEARTGRSGQARVQNRVLNGEGPLRIGQGEPIEEIEAPRPHRDPDDPTLSPWAKKLLEKYGSEESND